MLHILSLGTGKALAVGNVSISGELKTVSTGIGEATTTTLGGKVYNLQGVEVSRPQRGIYITGGRKYIAR